MAGGATRSLGADGTGRCLGAMSARQPLVKRLQSCTTSRADVLTLYFNGRHMNRKSLHLHILHINYLDLFLYLYNKQRSIPLHKSLPDSCGYM